MNMKYYFFLLLAVLFWSGNFVLGRYVSVSISAYELSFFRWFFVLLILSPYIFINYKRIKTIFLKNPVLYIFSGILGVSCYNTFVYFGLENISATNALLINTSTPIFIVVLSFFIFRNKISKIQVLGILISSFGVLYLILQGSLEAFLNLEFTKYDLWIILACISWALYSIFLKFKPKDLKALDFISIIVIFGVMVLFLGKLIFGFNFEYNFLHDQSLALTLGYVAIFPSILSFLFWNKATYEVGATKAGQFAHLMPLFGSFLAYVFLGETLEYYHLIGFLLISMGIYLSIFYKKSLT